MGKLVLTSGSARRGFRLSRQVFLEAKELDHMNQIILTYLKRRKKGILCNMGLIFRPWKGPLGMTDKKSNIYKEDTAKWDVRQRQTGRCKVLTCTDSLTHHMPHWLSSCYQSVCISPTLHGLPILVNMPHTRYPTAWKRAQSSTKNFLIPDHCSEIFWSLLVVNGNLEIKIMMKQQGHKLHSSLLFLLLSGCVLFNMTLLRYSITWEISQKSKNFKTSCV